MLKPFFNHQIGKNPKVGQLSQLARLWETILLFIAGGVQIGTILMEGN